MAGSIFTQQKNKDRKPITPQIPIRAELQAVIDSSPVGATHFLVHEWGKPFTANSFGNWFRDRCDEAGLKNCTSHGLRKAAPVDWQRATAAGQAFADDLPSETVPLSPSHYDGGPKRGTKPLTIRGTMSLWCPGPESNQ